MQVCTATVIIIPPPSISRYSHTSKDYISTSVAAPLWGFMVYALATKITLFLHILICKNNIRHIIYSTVSSLKQW